MKIYTVSQIASLWGISCELVEELCHNGEIKGAIYKNGEWQIPLDDGVGNYVNEHDSASVVREYDAILDIYKIPGEADSILESLKADEFSYDIFKAQLLFYRGDFKTSNELALKHVDDSETRIDHRVSVGMQLMLGSVYMGDLSLWRRGLAYLNGATVENEREKDLLDFWRAAGSCVVFDASQFPEWFCRGDFTHLPAESFAVASYHYVKYLYLLCNKYSASGDTERAKELLRAIPMVIEPIGSKVAFERCVIMEIYLRLLCALAYHLSGRDEYAIPHIDRALALAMPDKLFTPLAEYRHRFGFLMDDRIALKYGACLPEIKKTSRALVEGWTVLHNKAMGREVVSTLSTREWQAAKLASLGLSNKEIADQMGITVNAVKQALRLVMDKTGAESRNEIYKYL